MTNKISPVHPGEVLLPEFLIPWGVSQNQLAKHMGINVSWLKDVIRGRRGITGDTALKLERTTNTYLIYYLPPF
jgi:addiction module HigA family antidote